MEQAVRASISTPVFPSTFTVASTSICDAATSNAIDTFAIIKGWHSGMRSAVFLAAMMPARRAVARTSPFLAVPEAMIAIVSGFAVTQPRAVAEREVTALSETSTIWASPCSLRWLSLLMAVSICFAWQLQHPPAASGFHQSETSVHGPFPVVPDRRAQTGRFQR